MSRQYINEKWCVRCSKKEPTPYLRDKAKLLRPETLGQICVDIGCGNGRNSLWATKQGYRVIPFDMAGNCMVKSNECMLGHEQLTLTARSVRLVLMNYVAMFLDRKERRQVVDEIKRIADVGCQVVVELYPAKDSEAPDEPACERLRDELLKCFSTRAGWVTQHKVKNRFIVCKVKETA